MIRRVLALLHARNLEFVRDRSALIWNLAAPVLLVIAFAVIFAPGERDRFKVGVLSSAGSEPGVETLRDLRYVDFVPIADRDEGIRKVARHQLGMLIGTLGGRAYYWINSRSSDGYFLERLLLAGDAGDPVRGVVDGYETRPVDWLVPGIIGMNMMFSALFGVGYVVVRYRKNGYLRRLAATPLGALEFIIAQVASRLLLIAAVTVAVFVGADLLVDFRMEGSYATLALVAVLGGASLVALGLLVAARIASEELANGLLNLVSWPMMLLSGVWFSLEGSPAFVKTIAQAFPLTHLLDAARAVMLDGAGLVEVMPQLAVLLAMTALFTAAGAALFRWQER